VCLALLAGLVVLILFTVVFPEVDRFVVPDPSVRT